MNYHYHERSIMLLPSAEQTMDDEDVSETHILKTFNDPDFRNEETSSHTVERFFNSKTNPRTIHITYQKAHSLQYAHSLYTDTAMLVIEKIRVIQHTHTNRCTHPGNRNRE